MADYQASLKFLKPFEGYWANDPDDRGEETWCGITRKWYPNWNGWLYIDILKKSTSFPINAEVSEKLAALTEEFYKQEYWDRLLLNQVKSQPIADEIFELSINVGLRKGVKILQQALNLLNKAGNKYPDTDDDGIMGNATLNLVNSFHLDIKPLLKTINGLQFEHYVEICRKTPSQEKFFHGWLLRT